MPETWTNISLVGPSAGMFDAWFALYERYANEAGAQPNRRTGGTLWRWLLDGTYRVAGVVAVDSRKEVVGFAHYRPYPKTLDGSEACWIDDIFVAEAHREGGLTERLIDHVCTTARKRGWSDVTWIGTGYGPIREVFNRIAARDDVSTYRIPLIP
jgi:GNAT superfamily N-acetyltransferase